MNSFIIGILIAFTAALFTSLLTFTITTIAYRKLFKEMIYEALVSHEEKWHKDSMYHYVESEIDKHEKDCPAFQRFIAVEKAIYFLVVKAGGNPRNYGLVG